MASWLVGCGSTPSGTGADVPPAPKAPDLVVLLTPESAITSYLKWISFAYRVGDSSVASQTFTPYEEVRVNSYVQYNKQEGRAIDQRLTALRVKSATIAEATATVTAHEEWSYRYISLRTGKYDGPQRSASYESTYTVVRGTDELWRVDKVEATSTVPVE